MEKMYSIKVVAGSTKDDTYYAEQLLRSLEHFDTIHSVNDQNDATLYEIGDERVAEFLNVQINEIEITEVALVGDWWESNCERFSQFGIVFESMVSTDRKTVLFDCTELLDLMTPDGQAEMKKMLKLNDNWEMTEIPSDEDLNHCLECAEAEIQDILAKCNCNPNGVLCDWDYSEVLGKGYPGLPIFTFIGKKELLVQVPQTWNSAIENYLEVGEDIPVSHTGECNQYKVNWSTRRAIKSPESKISRATKFLSFLRSLREVETRGSY